MHGYEDKLEYLLRENDLKEVHEYFESENIELPTIQVDKISEKEAMDILGTTKKEFNELKQISDNFQHTSQSDIEKLEYVQRLLSRSKDRVLEHLQNLDEYDCENVDSSALTILSGIKKNGNDVFIIPRSSDNGKTITRDAH